MASTKGRSSTQSSVDRGGGGSEEKMIVICNRKDKKSTSIVIRQDCTFQEFVNAVLEKCGLALGTSCRICYDLTTADKVLALRDEVSFEAFKMKAGVVPPDNEDKTKVYTVRVDC